MRALTSGFSTPPRPKHWAKVRTRFATNTPHQRGKAEDMEQWWLQAEIPGVKSGRKAVISGRILPPNPTCFNEQWPIIGSPPPPEVAETLKSGTVDIAEIPGRRGRQRRGYQVTSDDCDVEQIKADLRPTPEWQCEVCDKTFPSEEWLSLHKEHQKHGRTSSEYKCEHCTYTTTEYTQLRQHLKMTCQQATRSADKLRHETKDVPGDICRICGETKCQCGLQSVSNDTSSSDTTYKDMNSVCTNLKQSLNSGLETEGSEFKCNTCGMKFSLDWDLKLHERTHVDTYCSDCDITVAEYRDFLQHKKGPHKRHYVCLFCGKLFPQLSNRKRHEKIHLGQKDYGCGLCGKSYFDKRDLLRHIDKLHKHGTEEAKDVSDLNDSIPHISKCEDGECVEDVEKEEVAEKPEASGTEQMAEAKQEEEKCGAGIFIGEEDAISETDWQCEICDKTFPSEEWLSLHKEHDRHWRDQPQYKCEHCTYTTTEYTQLAQHLVAGCSKTIEMPRPPAESSDTLSEFWNQTSTHVADKCGMCGKLECKCDIKPELISETCGHVTCECQPNVESSCKASNSVEGKSEPELDNVCKVCSFEKCKCAVQVHNYCKICSHEDCKCMMEMDGTCGICGQEICGCKATVSTHGDSTNNVTTQGTQGSNDLPDIGNEEYICLICGLEFQQRYELEDHGKVHGYVENFAVYGGGFSTLRALSQDGNTTSRKEFACRFCGKVFSQGYNMRRHEKNHLGLKDFICDHCGKTFAEKGNLVQHMETHNPNRIYNCQLCDISFRVRKYLVTHMRRAHKGQFTCNTCGVKFEKVIDLKKHGKSHMGSREYICSVCGRKYKTLSGLKLHKRKGQCCRVCGCIECKCGIISSLKDDVEKPDVHQGVLEQSKNQDIKGDDQGSNQGIDSVNCKEQRFVSIGSALSDGIKSEDVMYRCDVCGVDFNLVSELKMHEVTHMNTYCPDCDITVAEYSDFLEHKKGPHKKSWVCQFCGKLFPQLSNRKRHEKKHLGQRDYVCDICGKSYYDKRDLRSHMYRFHADIVDIYIP